MTATVLIVQHGEKERLPGDPGLTPAGRLQAAEVATFLEEIGSVTAVYSSPLRRARETAQPICDQLGLALQLDDRLQERMNWDGDQVQSLASFLDDWGKASSDRDFRPSSGDSSHLAGERFRRFLDALGEEGTAAVVSHGGVTTDLLRDLLGDDVLEARAPGLITNGVPCCAVTTLRRTGAGWSVVEIAATDHLCDTADHRPV